MIARKVRAAAAAGLTPLLCVGEPDHGSAAGAAEFVYRQIRSAVDGDWELAGRLVIAYEPVWAIGAAEPAAAGYVSDVVRQLRGHLAASGLEGLPVIYGGSAKPGSCQRSTASPACSWAGSRTIPRTSARCWMRHSCWPRASPRPTEHAPRGPRAPLDMSHAEPRTTGRMPLCSLVTAKNEHVPLTRWQGMSISPELGDKE